MDVTTPGAPPVTLQQQLEALARAPEAILPPMPTEPKLLAAWIAHILALRQRGVISQADWRDAMQSANAMNQTFRSQAELDKVEVEREGVGVAREGNRLMDTVRYGGTVMALADRVREDLRRRRAIVPEPPPLKALKPKRRKA